MIRRFVICKNSSIPAPIAAMLKVMKGAMEAKAGGKATKGKAAKGRRRDRASNPVKGLVISQARNLVKEGTLRAVKRRMGRLRMGRHKMGRLVMRREICKAV